MAYKNPETRRAYRRMYYYSKKYFHSPKCRYARVRGLARRRGVGFDLTLDDYLRIVAVGTCYYCGDPLPELGHGIDRMNHEKGYIQGNCVSCCSWCNNKKGLLEAAGFVAGDAMVLLRRLVERRKTMKGIADVL